MRAFLEDMNLLDWVLAAAFVLVLVFLGNALLKPGGWLAGLFAAITLLYLAKRRRNELKKPRE